MAGTISSLGIGSGVLTADVIDKLKKSDESLMLTPIDNKITLQKQKTSALDLLKSLMTTFKSSVSALEDDTLYQKRTVSGNNDGVSVSALSGSAVQSFSISDTQMALKNVRQSGTFTATDALITSGISPISGTMTLSIDGSSYDIPYTDETNLTDLKEAINTTAGAKITASILQTGTDEYRLILTSKETGADQTITITDSAGELNNALKPYDPDTNPDGVQEIQAARDASFTYNGVAITRSTNSVDDLIVGVTIDILKDDGDANISITQNTSAISDELQNLTNSYNTLMKQLDDMTLSDLENGKVGIFNGDNSIKSIRREITKIITSLDTEGNSLAQYGISLSQEGTMTFSETDFNTQISGNTEQLEAFFSGSMDTEGNYTEGLFERFNNQLGSYTDSNGLLSTLLDASTKESTNLATERSRSAKFIEARYETMAARFVQYDTIMSRLSSQFTALQQQIEMAINANG